MLWLSVTPPSAAGQIPPLPLLAVLIPAIVAVASTFHKGLNKATQSDREAQHFGSVSNSVVHQGKVLV